MVVNNLTPLILIFIEDSPIAKGFYPLESFRALISLAISNNSWNIFSASETNIAWIGHCNL
jgi:hypothetical protein